MNPTHLPGFTAWASLSGGGEHYQARAFPSPRGQVIPQLSAFCIHAANRAYDRCRLIGYGNATCAQFAVWLAETCDAD